MRRSPAPRTNHLYPSGDGKPMAETDFHRDVMFRLIEMLQLFFRHEPDTYVAGNMLMYYEEGNRRAHVSPDVFVVFGIHKDMRDNYLIWEEGRSPDVVFEMTSKTTKKEDLVDKMSLYRDVLKVKEYFLFDPCEDYLDPSMQGYRLRTGEYRPIAWKNGRLPSRELGLHLEREGHLIRLWNPETDAWLPTQAELTEAAQHQAEDAAAKLAEARRAQLQERAAKEALEAEVARLRKLLQDRPAS